MLQSFRYRGARTPLDEAERAQTLRQMGLLDTAPEKKYEEVTSLLQELFEVQPPPHNGCDCCANALRGAPKGCQPSCMAVPPLPCQLSALGAL